MSCIPHLLFFLLTGGVDVCAGVGMDCCVIPLKHGRLSLVQTTDFFYPLVDDPYMMVRPPSEDSLSSGLFQF